LNGISRIAAFPVPRVRGLACALGAGLLLAATAAGVRADGPQARAPGTIHAYELPSEARETLALIRQGGPFPYPRDGIVFSNRERLLPAAPRGTYREYTVRTPGRRDRGARRIIASRGDVFYYTDDHYRSFRRILE
jgi:ribonuclease T1